jgi:ABC-type nitrate/sulfonate/bicarbonate transport system substrate-binding protein
VIITKNAFDKKHGWDLRWELRPTSDAYYNDFVTGVYESIDFGGLNVFANLHNRGVPLKIVQATVRWPVPVVARTNANIKSLADLKGKKVAVGRASFAYAHLSGALRNHGIDLDKDTELSNVDFFQAFPRLRRGDFDAAVLLFEHAIQLITEQPNDFVILGDASAEFAKSIGVKAIYQYQAVRNDWLEKNPGAVANVIATYQDSADFFSKRPAEAVKLLALPLDQKGANLNEQIGAVAYITGTPKGLKTEHLARPVADIKADAMIELEAYRRLGLIEKVPAPSFFL